MNTKKNWTKGIGVAVLVALTSVVVAGPVAAVPGIPMGVNRVTVDTPPVGTDESSSSRFFEQYMAAPERAEREPSTSTLASSVNSQTRFEQYRGALKQMERDHNWERFEQYLKASEQTGSAHNASPVIVSANDADNSWTRFEQYLEYAR